MAISFFKHSLVPNTESYFRLIHSRITEEKRKKDQQVFKNYSFLREEILR